MQPAEKTLNFDDWIDRVKTWISDRDKLCIKSSILFSVITHCYIFTNPLFNHDSIYLVHHNEMTSSGRWLLEIVTRYLQSYYRMPWITALWTILFFACASVGIVHVLGIRSKIGLVLSCALLNAFPTVACTLAYNFTASSYFAAMVLAVCGAWCCLSKRRGFLLLGGLLLSASMGLYQAYISVAATLFVFVLLLEALYTPGEWKNVLAKGLRCFLGLLMGFGFYLMFLKLACHLRGVTLSNYRSINEMGKYKLSEIPQLLSTTYQQVWEHFMCIGGRPFFSASMVWAQRLIMLAGLAAVLILFIKNRVYHKWPAAVLIVVLMAISPIAINALQILNPQEAPHALMIYSFVLPLLFVIRAVELLPVKKLCRFVKIAALTLCAFLAFRFVILSNIGYLRLQTVMQSTEAFANRLAARVELQPGYGELPVYLTDGYPYRFVDSRLENAFPGLFMMTGIDIATISPTSNNLYAFLQEVLRVPVSQPSSEQIAQIEASQEYQDMPSWPAEGCVAVIEDVIVVKLSPETNE